MRGGDEDLKEGVEDGSEKDSKRGQEVQEAESEDYPIKCWTVLHHGCFSSR